eukprot:TRINITY_DN28506_c0_g1_i1.p1 TRINITY_DN28506_c0_g1~~TRINITY_DN28506_c0_g1_i1.p1  ORF type:complete len:588 (-),score=87.48 TRINITY_DN28506_c0_g1_i1:238-2001(-)
MGPCFSGYKKQFKHADMVRTFQGKLSEKYDIVEQIGFGNQGKTYLVKSKTRFGLGSTKFAAKETLDLSSGGKSSFIREFNNWKSLQHPNCLKVFELIEGKDIIDGEWKDHIYVITEYACGTDLFKYINCMIHHDCRIDEEWISDVFRQAMSGVAYLHEKGLVHNDLKPDNILCMEAFDPKHPMTPPTITIGDFGCATSPSDRVFLPGDPRYQSPETWKLIAQSNNGSLWGKTTGPKADIWSMGVTLFELLSGGLIPFLYKPCSLDDVLTFPSLYKELEEKVQNEEVSIREHCSSTEEALELLKGTLCKDPDKRLSAQSVRKAAWCNLDTQSPSKRQRSNELSAPVLAKLELKTTKTMAHTILLNALAMKLKRDHYEECWKAFQAMDRDHSGTVSVDEFAVALEKIGRSRSRSEVEQLHASADVDKDGNLNFMEFIAVTFDWHSLDRSEMDATLRHLFLQLDIDLSGTVSIDELNVLFHGSLSKEELQDVFDRIDQSGSGQFSLADLNNFVFDCVLEGRLSEPSLMRQRGVSCRRRTSQGFGDWVTDSMSSGASWRPEERRAVTAISEQPVQSSSCACLQGLQRLLHS